MKKKYILKNEVLLHLSWPGKYTLRFILELNNSKKFNIRHIENIAKRYDNNSNPTQSLQKGLNELEKFHFLSRSEEYKPNIYSLELNKEEIQKQFINDIESFFFNGKKIIPPQEQKGGRG